MLNTSSTNGITYLLWWILLLFMLLALYMPWMVNPAASLSTGAADLAEWASLHPAAGALNTSLALRLPFVCLTLVVAISTPVGERRARWLHTVVVLAMWVALLPPFEFIFDADARSNPNFQQQALLFMVSVIGGSLGLSGILRRGQGILLLLASTGMAASIAGSAGAYELMAAFDLPVQVGTGAAATSAGWAILVLAWLVRRTKQGGNTGILLP